ncbi:uroporphyrinogen-III synthase [Limnohabitans sp. JirII-31]|uniref:uroporphyrinogen-III synthase n=1 Tax=Limnohabitans sp. JirII-31 TaxID=1977908 RepID=UPI001E4DECEF|nr:uroporphyrinogen-III synthase [Limnohabitans sp. JirII-31]
MSRQVDRAMRVWITRPANDAPAWVNALRDAGHEPRLLPLIEIAPVADVAAIDLAWSQWSQWQAVMFVSAPAVRFFFARQPDDVQWGALGTRCWATGPGTRNALLKAGVPPALIDSPAEDAGQFDSEALWKQVHAGVMTGQPVLIVRGSDASGLTSDVNHEGVGRDWLAQQLRAAHVPVHFVVAYQRQAPVWTLAQRMEATQAASDGSVWCLSSSQAVAHLKHGLPGQDWTRARCIVTHERIAQAAQALGFGEVHVARPVLADVLASLESLA